DLEHLAGFHERGIPRASRTPVCDFLRVGRRNSCRQAAGVKSSTGALKARCTGLMAGSVAPKTPALPPGTDLKTGMSKVQPPAHAGADRASGPNENDSPRAAVVREKLRESGTLV